jgi:glucokinase
MVRIGIDVGGTGIQTGVVSSDGKILAEESIVTLTDIPFSDQIVRMTDSVRSVLKSAGMTEDDVELVGVGIPGIASRETGEVIKCTNMGWSHVPFRTEWEKNFPKTVLIENDANVAALAESVAGVSAGSSSSVFITIGTGIGSGIVIDGKIWSGFHGIGGELGHTIMDLDGVPCTCGNHGCLERYCSATALIRMAREAVMDQPDCRILKEVGGDPNRISARTVIDLAREADPLATALYRRWISYLGQAIANVANFLDPEIIVLGGGVSKAGAFLLDAVTEEFPKYVLFRDQLLPEIKLAVLGAKAGIIGAAMLS